MEHLTEPVSPHEKFGFELLQRAFRGESLQTWENDFARIFWQLLEVHNGGFAQWIGNTGKIGAFETLLALQRCSLPEARRITAQAFEVGCLDEFEGNKPYYDYLKEAVVNWFERLRHLDETYWDESDNIHDTLKSLHQAHVVDLH